MCRIKSLLDIMQWIQDMSVYLNGKIDFDETGWPIFRKEHFLLEWPEYVITFQHRNNMKNNYPRDKTVLCF